MTEFLFGILRQNFSRMDRWAQGVTVKIKLKLKCFQAWGQIEFQEPSLTSTCIRIWIPNCIDTNYRTWAQKQVIPFTNCWNHEEAPQSFSFQSLVLSLRRNGHYRWTNHNSECGTATCKQTCVLMLQSAWSWNG